MFSSPESMSRSDYSESASQSIFAGPAGAALPGGGRGLDVLRRAEASQRAGASALYLDAAWAPALAQLFGVRLLTNGEAATR